MVKRRLQLAGYPQRMAGNYVITKTCELGTQKVNEIEESQKIMDDVKENLRM